MGLRDGLVGAWCPSFGPTASTLLDRSGRNNHGTLINMDQSTDWVQSGGAGALDFDGTNDEVNCGTSSATASLATTTNNPGGTFSFWIRPNSVAVSGTIMARNDGNSVQAGWWLLQINQTVQITFERTVGNARHTSANALTTDWQHVVLSWRAGLPGTTSTGDFLAWRNGQSITMSANAVGSGTQAADSDLVETLYLARYGKTTSGGNGFFAGQLDDIAVWKRQLTASEIQQLYRQGRGQWLRPPRRRVYGYAATSTGRRRRILCGEYG
jgi:hypothetical protein